MANTDRYFITGSQGCIGAWVVKQLLDRGAIAHCFDLTPESRRLSLILTPDEMGRVQFQAGDVTDGKSVRTALEKSGARRIIHLAGLQVPACKADPVAGAMVNVIGTLNIFEAARDLGINRLAYASSAAVFGPTGGNPAPVDESAACEPITHYGVFKQANEGSARIFYLDNGISSAGIRPLTVYGVGRDQGATSDPTKAMKAAVLGRTYHIRWSGKTDLVYVADTAAAFIACADRCPEGAHVFNLHGDTADVAEVVRLIEAEAPASKGLVSFGGPELPIPTAMNDRALRAAIDGLPSTPIRDGIKETVRRFVELREQNRLDPYDLV